MPSTTPSITPNSPPRACHTKLDLVSTLAHHTAPQHAHVDSSVKHWNDTLQRCKGKPHQPTPCLSHQT